MSLSKIFNEELTLKYLTDTVREFKANKRGKRVMFSCPVCGKEEAANFIPNTGGKVFCLKCNKKLGNVVEIARLLEFPNYPDCDIISHLSCKYSINVTTNKEVDEFFSFYNNYGFDLVPIARNDKRPIEQDWVNQNHKEIAEWKDWIKSGLNIGVKCGKVSNIVVIDCDGEIPELLKNCVTLSQKSNKGMHYFFEYDEEIGSSRIQDNLIDILSDGRQCVIFPSVIDDVKRVFSEHKTIEVMPKNIKDWLFTKVKRKKTEIAPVGNTNLSTSNVEVKAKETTFMGEGSGRNNLLVHIGGILKKELSIKQCGFTLELINQKFFAPKLSEKEMKGLVGSLEKYIGYDENDLANKVYEYVQLVSEANSRDVAYALNEKKLLVDKALEHLVRNQKILKKGRNYITINTVELTTKLLDNSQELGFEVPYFGEIANLYKQDSVLIGSSKKVGKTHIAMNIIRRLVEQGIKPIYYNSEAGNRFRKIALKLGLKEGDFEYPKKGFSKPEGIKFFKDRVHIIDWVRFNDYAKVDEGMDEIRIKLMEANAFAFIFMQLKDDGGWYGKNMATFFPALTVKYFYDDISGTTGYFLLDDIRDPKMQIKVYKIPCRYDYDSKQLLEIEAEK